MPENVFAANAKNVRCKPWFSAPLLVMPFWYFIHRLSLLCELHFICCFGISCSFTPGNLVPSLCHRSWVIIQRIRQGVLLEWKVEHGKAETTIAVASSATPTSRHGFEKLEAPSSVNPTAHYLIVLRAEGAERAARQPLVRTNSREV